MKDMSVGDCLMVIPVYVILWCIVIGLGVPAMVCWAFDECRGQ